MESEGLIMVEGKGFKKRILELCFLFYFILFYTTVLVLPYCQGPAPVDPGYFEGRQSWNPRKKLI